jgi:hypothetical protein
MSRRSFNDEAESARSIARVYGAKHRSAPKGRQRLGGAGHQRTATPAHIDQPFLTQILVGVKHGVQIEAQGCRHLPRRRKPIARLQSAGVGNRTHRRSQLL